MQILIDCFSAAPHLTCLEEWWASGFSPDTLCTQKYLYFCTFYNSSESVSTSEINCTTLDLCPSCCWPVEHIWIGHDLVDKKTININFKVHWHLVITHTTCKAQLGFSALQAGKFWHFHQLPTFFWAIFELFLISYKHRELLKYFKGCIDTLQSHTTYTVALLVSSAPQASKFWHSLQLPSFLFELFLNYY